MIHFYETFLAAYDARLRKVRGVYYTPEPVVSYIVRSVDRLLRSRFKCPAGLADTARTADGQPRVLVLDPACGTGTFLYAVVDHIREAFRQRGNAGMWSGFVREYLLPRLFGFELLMGAYAVAHFKLGMQLAAQDLPDGRATWAYDFAGDDRLGIYLTNTLEEAVRRSDMLMARYISDEANAAVNVKRDLPIMVVLGNPPYAGHSANASWRMVRVSRPGARQRMRRVPTWIGDRLQTYYEVDEKPLGERNPKWLQDDYVKFIRFGQWRIEQTGAGVLAFITNHGYLDNPTFRGMRQQLMQTFTDIYVLDLHGNARKREQAPDGGPDDNVFDIEQGVAIGLFVKAPEQDGPARVHHAELWGEREGKYDWLDQSDVETTDWTTLAPQSPFYLFVPQNVDLHAEYEQGTKITEAMPVNSLGVTTARDRLTIHWTDDDLKRTVEDFAALPTEEAREKYSLRRDARDWKVALAQADLQEHPDIDKHVSSILYRPFDSRFTYYTGQSRGFMCMPRSEVMRHMLAGGNLAIITTRQTRDDWDIFVTQHIAGHKSLAAYDASSVFPLWCYPEPDEPAVTEDGKNEQLSMGIRKEIGQKEPSANFSDAFVQDVCGRLNGQWLADGRPVQAPAGLDDPFEIAPEDLFHYIYAVLHAPTYRSRYAEFLRIDFPRVPLTSDRALFRTLAAKGAELIAYHLLEAPALATSTVQYPVPGEHLVEKGHPRYLAPGDPDPTTGEPLTAGRVYISRDMPRRGQQGQYFAGIPPEVWAFHVGGYQVCDKWLKDRRGRTLTYDDIEHYGRIVTALQETIRLMAEIDAAIPTWPLA